MPRANLPVSREAAEAVHGHACVAIFDIILLAIGLVLLGIYGFTGTDAELTEFHGAHFLLLAPALLCLVCSVLFMGIYFLIIGLPIFFLDIYILVTRFMRILAAFSIDTFMYLLLDVAFLITAMLYMAWTARSLAYYDLFGDSAEPQADGTPSKVLDQQGAKPFAKSNKITF